MRRVTPFLLALVISVGACRDDPTGPPQDSAITPAVTAASTPHFLRAKAGAPTIANPVIRFYAKKGQRKTVFMLYHARPGQRDSTDLIRFRLRENSLLARPDGRPIKNGETVLITLRLVDPVKLIVDFQPAGLRFNPRDPADLDQVGRDQPRCESRRRGEPAGHRPQGTAQDLAPGELGPTLD